MKRFFSFKRFVKFLGYDIVNAKNYFGMSLLICGMMPLIVYLFFQLFSIIISGHISDDALIPQVTALCVSFCVVVLCFPAKVYGSITERRAGTSRILLPASVFEKWLSMFVVTCVVLPVCFGVLFFGVDALMSVCVDNYSNPLAGYVFNFKKMLADLSEDARIMGMHLDYTGLFLIGWCDSILIYLLGALFFKKSKIAKTILVLMAFGTIVSIFTGSLIHNGFSFGITDDMGIEQINYYLDRINAFAYWYYIAIFVVINALIYWRLRTIKH